MVAFPRGSPLTPSAEEPATWLDPTPPAAEGERFATLSAELYALTVPRPMLCLALAFAPRPDALAATLALGRQVGLGGSGLGRELEATIGLVVAATLGTAYTGVHYAQTLLAAGAPTETVMGLIRDPSGGTLSGRERAVAAYSERLTRAPGTMTRDDVGRLRVAGLDDAGIITVVATVAYENYLARVAAGCGVRVEVENFYPTLVERFGVAIVRGT